VPNGSFSYKLFYRTFEHVVTMILIGYNLLFIRANHNGMFLMLNWRSHKASYEVSCLLVLQSGQRVQSMLAYCGSPNMFHHFYSLMSMLVWHLLSIRHTWSSAVPEAVSCDGVCTTADWCSKVQLGSFYMSGCFDDIWPLCLQPS